MRRRRDWSNTETKVLIDNYQDKTIKELQALFPERSAESINNKIKRLKKQGRIKDGKDQETVQRAYEQRGKNDVDVDLDGFKI